MPELPEVEVVRKGLELHLPGRIITAVRHDGKKLRSEVPYRDMQTLLPGNSIVALKRRAKYLLIEMSNTTLLIIHLGMTGKLGLFEKSSPALVHDHIAWQLDNGLELRFNDVRRFVYIFYKTTGPEPFDADFNADYLYRRAAGRTVPVKNFIMNSSVVAGIGNIYANESLFAAGIRPSRPAGKISLKRWELLIDKTRAVLRHAICCGGSSISDFIGASGEKGYFQIRFCVYGRTGEQCPHCTASIKALRLGGRASFFCPKCQR